MIRHLPLARCLGEIIIARAWSLGRFQHPYCKFMRAAKAALKRTHLKRFARFNAAGDHARVSFSLLAQLRQDGIG
jgi:hypothetical protein